MTTTPPGWYDDGSGTTRWWDGAQWGEPVAPPAAVPDEAVPDAAVPDATVPDAAAVSPSRTSKRWIVWVSVGAAVLLVLLVSVAVLVTVSLMNGSVRVPQGAAEPGATVETERPAPESQEPLVLSAADREAATATVMAFDEAWRLIDCDAYFTTTTAEFREASGFADCAAFEHTARELAATTEGYSTTPDGVRVDGDAAVVTTTEMYKSAYGADGELLPEPAVHVWVYDYYLIEVDGVWVIDNLLTV